MTAKHTRQSYFEKQKRLAAKTLKGICEEIITNTKIAKQKARPLLIPFLETAASRDVEGKGSQFIQEFVPFHKRKKKKAYRGKK